MTTAEAVHIGALLDEHHAPETNGRMAVCRRCGARTNDPEGRRHAPAERCLADNRQWLDTRVRTDRLHRAKGCGVPVAGRQLDPVC
jgi:hypothetical protein